MHHVRPSVRVSAELRDLVPRFLANRRLDLDQLRDALARGDLEQARRVGHTLKGVGGGYGFDEITRLGGEIERAVHAGGAGLDALVRELAHFVDHVEITFADA